jgi:hypothetical protein
MHNSNKLVAKYYKRKSKLDFLFYIFEVLELGIKQNINMDTDVTSTA